MRSHKNKLTEFYEKVLKKKSPIDFVIKLSSNQLLKTLDTFYLYCLC